jgi:twitching motility protein PilJ
MNIRTMSPAGLLSGLKLGKKFQILGVLALVLVLVPFYEVFTTAQTGVETANHELSGFEPAGKLLKVVKLTQEHRGLSAGALAGNEQMAADLVPKKAEVDKAVGEMDAEISRIDNAPIRDAWGKAKQEWGGLGSNVASRTIKSGESYAEHTRIIASYLSQMDLIVDHFGLSLDSNAANYNLIQAAYNTIPRLTESLGQLRAQGTGVLARAAERGSAEASLDEGLSLAERVALATALTEGNNALEASILALNKAMNAAPKLRQTLQAPLSSADESGHGILEMVRKEVAESTRLTMAPGDYFASVTDALGEQLQLSETATAALGASLKEAADALRYDQIVTSAIIVGLMLVGIFLAVFVMRTITGPVGHLQSVMQQLREGDTTARANLETNDEIGVLARHFDEMVNEREAATERIKKENDRLNESVLSLLQGVALLARKDLTSKVPVAEDVTGAVSDALNLLTSETAKVLKQVTDISADVTGASLKVREQSDTVMATADAERNLVEKTVEELQLSAQAMANIELLAQSANLAADNALKTTQAALMTVNATVGGINNTRDTIRETEKRIKRLGERSQEISGVVGLINTIAERTHILALNASMHAASAGEAGRGFAVVAEEVQRLAENSRQATAQIATLVNNIQVETVDTVNTMNAAITQVVDGSRLAEQAGEQMKLTQEATAGLVESVRQIASSSQEQAQQSSGLLSRAEDIRKSSEHTSRELVEQSEQTGNLVEYAKALLGAVRVFKLPA